MVAPHTLAAPGRSIMKLLSGALFAVVLAVGTSTIPATAKPATSPTVGSTIKTKLVKVTLHAYRQPVTNGTPVETTAVGTETAAINVEACNNTTGTQTVAPYQFFLETPDGHLVFPAKSSRTPRPQLPATPLTSRRCARGWLSYQVPAGTRAVFVVFQAGAMFTNTLHKWTVPASAAS
jgi:hypothetical protein